MNDAELIREVARRGPLEIRVLCPAGKGHLVADYTLSASDGQLFMRLCHSKNLGLLHRLGDSFGHAA